MDKVAIYALSFLFCFAILAGAARLFLGPTQPPGGEVKHEPVKQFLRPRCGAFTHHFTGGKDTFTCTKGSNHLGAHEGFDDHGKWARWKYEPIPDGHMDLRYLERN